MSTAALKVLTAQVAGRRATCNTISHESHCHGLGTHWTAPLPSAVAGSPTAPRRCHHDRDRYPHPTSTHTNITCVLQLYYNCTTTVLHSHLSSSADATRCDQHTTIHSRSTHTHPIGNACFTTRTDCLCWRGFACLSHVCPTKTLWMLQLVAHDCNQDFVCTCHAPTWR